MNPHHAGPLGEPSPWLVRWSHLLAPRSRVLDVACGSGRHLHYMHTLGHQVTGVDLDISTAQSVAPYSELIQADLETQPWPLHDGQGHRLFDAVLVCNYLWRPLWPSLRASLAPGGVLLYETFASGQEQWGRPRNPDVLLQPGDQSLCLPLLCNDRADLSRYVADVGVHGSEIGVQQEYVVDGRSKKG